MKIGGNMPRPVNTARLKKRIDNLEVSYKEMNSIIEPKQSRPQIRCGTYSFNVKKAINKPNFSNKTVLTDSTWDYVLTYIAK